MTLRPEMELWERFWVKVNKNGPIPDYRSDLGPCWMWESALESKGYGQFGIQGRNRMAHRLSFMFYYGPIHDKLEVDHLCRAHACVNPAHLEAVTKRENMRRGVGRVASNMDRTHCWAGHEYTPENLYINPASSQRVCRKCNNRWQRDYQERRKVTES
jgi:hypothetical protein